MKLLLLLPLIAACLSVSVRAQSAGGPWTITSSTVDGGGTTSTGGSWTATGTIGQPDATVQQSTGTVWTVAGGFWPGVVAVPGGPILTISCSDNSNATIAWTAAAVGCKLQYSTNLVSWSDYPGLTITGASSVVWPLANGPRCFFRLKKL